MAKVYNDKWATIEVTLLNKTLKAHCSPEKSRGLGATCSPIWQRVNGKTPVNHRIAMIHAVTNIASCWGPASHRSHPQSLPHLMSWMKAATPGEVLQKNKTTTCAGGEMEYDDVSTVHYKNSLIYIVYCDSIYEYDNLTYD